MFDIGFWELVLVGVVALLVFGPERLPRVARETALWVRKARSMVASVKSEIDQELRLEELRQSLNEERRKLEKEAAAFKGMGEELAKTVGNESKPRSGLDDSRTTRQGDEQG